MSGISAKVNAETPGAMCVSRIVVENWIVMIDG
jgi:hypothetical protein